MAKYVIDEAFLSQLERLQTLLKNNVGGMFGGNRKSKTFGSSCGFPWRKDLNAFAVLLAALTEKVEG